jgi:predicted aspartyl protease
MASLSVTYDRRIRWGTATNNASNRPYAMIRVHDGPGPGGFDLFGLLDTGADYLMLETRIARALGIDLRGCPRETVMLASGARARLPRAQVDMSMRGKRVTVDAIFGIRGTPLIGRTAILRAIDFGIDIDGWLYRIV